MPNVKAQVLALSDLPAGWSKHKQIADGKGAPSCLRALTLPPSSATRANASFQVSPQGVPALAETIGYVAEGAAEDFADAVKVLDKCGKISSRSATTSFSGVMAEISFPPLGDQSKAYQVVFSGLVKKVKVTVGYDLLLVRVGDEELTLIFWMIGVPQVQEFQAAAKLAMNKITGTGHTV